MPRQEQRQILSRWPRHARQDKLQARRIARIIAWVRCFMRSKPWPPLDGELNPNFATESRNFPHISAIKLPRASWHVWGNHQLRGVREFREDVLGREKLLIDGRGGGNFRMAIYIYETIPAGEGQPVRTYEIRQSMKDAALTKHPETGEPIRRVITGGLGVMTSSKAGGSQPAVGGHCCGGGCGCR